MTQGNTALKGTPAVPSIIDSINFVFNLREKLSGNKRRENIRVDFIEELGSVELVRTHFQNLRIVADYVEDVFKTNPKALDKMPGFDFNKLNTCLFCVRYNLINFTLDDDMPNRNGAVRYKNDFQHIDDMQEVARVYLYLHGMFYDFLVKRVAGTQTGTAPVRFSVYEALNSAA